MRKFVGIIIGLLLFPWLVSLAWSQAAKGTDGDASGETRVEAADTRADTEEDSDAAGMGQADKEGGAVQTGAGDRRILVERNGIQT